jgi:hypothetical protein
MTFALPATSAPSGAKFTTTLTGATEVPGPGDPDGAGAAKLTVNPGLGTICYALTVRNIEPAVGAHIHEAPVGVAGPIVAHLQLPSPTSSSGCVTDRALARDIVRNPADYYVNVHTADYPAGAVRGQVRR